MCRPTVATKIQGTLTKRVIMIRLVFYCYIAVLSIS